MSSTSAARRKILDTLYSLQRRKTVLPTGSNCLLDNHTSFGQSSRARKSLSNKVERDLTTPRSIPHVSKPKVTRYSISTNAVPISLAPFFLRKDLLRLQGPNKVVRAHYDVATYEEYDDYLINDVFRGNHKGIYSIITGQQYTNLSIEKKVEDVSPKSDLVVVLDMDECIIHSQFLTSVRDSENKYRQYEYGRPPSQAFTHDDEPESIIPSSCESFRLCLSDGDHVHVNKRPNLDHFLKQVTSRYETYIFTAAMEVYAAPLLDRLDPDGNMFAGRFYREHCTFEKTLGVYVKDLNNIKLDRSREEINSTNNLEGMVTRFDDKRVVLVDNNPYSFLANPTNGILVSNFYDDAKDDTLQAVIELLSELDSVEDVRPVLDEKFGLQDALKEVTKIQGFWN